MLNHSMERNGKLVKGCLNLEMALVLWYLVKRYVVTEYTEHLGECMPNWIWRINVQIKSSLRLWDDGYLENLLYDGQIHE